MAGVYPSLAVHGISSSLAATPDQVLVMPDLKQALKFQGGNFTFVYVSACLDLAKLAWIRNAVHIEPHKANFGCRIA